MYAEARLEILTPHCRTLLVDPDLGGVASERPRQGCFNCRQLQLDEQLHRYEVLKIIHSSHTHSFSRASHAYDDGQPRLRDVRVLRRTYLLLVVLLRPLTRSHPRHSHSPEGYSSCSSCLRLRVSLSRYAFIAYTWFVRSLITTQGNGERDGQHWELGAGGPEAAGGYP